MQNILLIDLCLKLGGGLLLIVAPLSVCRVFGLPKPNTGFWPRILGAVLIGHAGGLFLEGIVPNVHGLGLGGSLIINLCTAGMIGALLILNAVGSTRRAKFFLWLLVFVLCAISLAELAFVS